MPQAIVLYMVEGPIRGGLGRLEKLFEPDETPRPLVVERDDIIILVNEPHHEAFTAFAQQQWVDKKVRISFFALKNLISNPAKHFFVPPHRKLTADEATAVMKHLSVDSKSAFPHIKYHADMQARVLGLVPGDLVEIQRPSDTSGITTLFRVCTL